MEPIKNLSEISVEELVEKARQAGQEFKNIKINQIRRFLDGVRRIENRIKAKASFDEVKDQIVLLRPMLAYAAGRKGTKEMKGFMDFLDPAIRSGSQSPENFRKLLRLIEGLVAYHRYYGGKN